MLIDYLWLENKEKHAMWRINAGIFVVLLNNTDNFANFCFEISSRINLALSKSCESYKILPCTQQGCW